MRDKFIAPRLNLKNKSMTPMKTGRTIISRNSKFTSLQTNMKTPSDISGPKHTRSGAFSPVTVRILNWK